MHCVITGVAGFIGSTLCETLLKQGHSVKGIDCFTDYYPRAVKEQNLQLARQSNQFNFIEEDLADTNIDALLDGAEWVFHEAAQAGVRASWGDYFSTYSRNNIVATQRLLEGCRRCATLRKVVYASSSSIYGDAEAFPTPERTLPRPVSPYGVSKLAGEHLMYLYAREFSVPTVALRYFTVYGPRQRPDMGFHKFIRAALLNEEIALYGDGEQSRDFTFVSDIVRANILAAERGPAGTVFNIGGGAVTSINQVFRILEDLTGKLRIQRGERQKGDAQHTSADVSRAKEQLSYCPQVDIRTGIRCEVEWLKEVLQR